MELNKEEIEKNVKNILDLVGEDSERQGLKRTPEKGSQSLRIPDPGLSSEC